MDITEIPDEPGFGISRDGRVWTRWYKPHRGGRGHGRWEWKLLDEWTEVEPREKGNYLVVMLYSGRRTIHHAVLETFVGPCPVGLEACHKNDDKHDNRIENLYWGTRSQNVQDQIRNGIHGSRHSSPIEKTCPTCNQLFSVQPSRNDRVYCSVQCRPGTKGIHTKPRVTIQCLECDKPFEVLGNSTKLYCSRACSNRARSR